MVLELSCLEIFREHDIELFVRPTLRLRHSEERPHERNRSETAEEEANFTTGVGLVRVDEVSASSSASVSEDPTLR